MEHLRWRNRKRIPSPKNFSRRKSSRFKISRFKVNRKAIPIEEKNSSRRTSRNYLLQDLSLFYLKNDCEKWNLKNYFAPEGQIKIEKIDTQTVWKAEKRIKLFPWDVTNQKIVWKRICLIKEKREELKNSTFRQL